MKVSTNCLNYDFFDFFDKRKKSGKSKETKKIMVQTFFTI